MLLNEEISKRAHSSGRVSKSHVSPTSRASRTIGIESRAGAPVYQRERWSILAIHLFSEVESECRRLAERTVVVPCWQ